MAKAFTADEKKAITERLKNEAVRCLTGSGIRKTTVDELASAAGISKGAFYFFFPSKEVLFFAVIQDWHEKTERLLLSDLEASVDSGPESLTEILLQTFRFVESSFFPKLVSGGELELLMRKLPADVIAGHLENDTAFFSRILEKVPSIDPSGAERYSAAFRAVFLLLPHRREIGTRVFDEVLEMLVSGIVRDMFEGGRQ